MLSLAGPGADDDAGHGRLLEDVAGGHVGDRHLVSTRHRIRGAQHPLQGIPPAGDAHEAAVLHLRPRAAALPVGLRLTEPSIRQPAPGERSVSEEPDAAREAHGRQRPGRSPIEQREADLVRNHLDAGGANHVQVRRVHVRQADVRDQSLGLQRLQMPQAVDPARIGIAPRMELQQIDPARPKPLQRPFDRRTDVVERQRPRLRHPLREQLHGMRRARTLAQMARHDLGRPVVIGHVERREAGVDVDAKGPRRGLGVKRAAVALHVGDLPQAGQHAGDGEIGGQRDPFHGEGHESYPGGRAAKRASRSTPWRRSFCVSRK